MDLHLDILSYKHCGRGMGNCDLSVDSPRGELRLEPLAGFAPTSYCEVRGLNMGSGNRDDLDGLDDPGTPDPLDLSRLPFGGIAAAFGRLAPVEPTRVVAVAGGLRRQNAQAAMISREAGRAVDPRMSRPSRRPAGRADPHAVLGMWYDPAAGSSWPRRC